MENSVKFESLYSNREERRLWTHPSSPEFEFWMVRNPSLPQPNMLSADELFVDGVLLPLDLVSASAPLQESPVIQENESYSAGPEITAPATASGSRRWKDMFKKVSKETDQEVESGKMSKKRERKSGGGHVGGGASAAELNINIWPFSRSRSAGNGGGHSGARVKVATSRKVTSAPCSRSNSGGESKSRKWPASPGRAFGGGVYVGRTSPVWQVRRGGSATVPRSSTASEVARSQKAKVLKGCKQGVAAAADGGGFSRKGSGGSNDGSGVVNLFSLRSLFGKKVY